MSSFALQQSALAWQQAVASKHFAAAPSSLGGSRSPDLKRRCPHITMPTTTLDGGVLLTYPQRCIVTYDKVQRLMRQKARAIQSSTKDALRERVMQKVLWLGLRECYAQDPFIGARAISERTTHYHKRSNTLKVSRAKNAHAKGMPHALARTQYTVPVSTPVEEEQVTTLADSMDTKADSQHAEQTPLLERPTSDLFASFAPSADELACSASEPAFDDDDACNATNHLDYQSMYQPGFQEYLTQISSMCMVA